MIRNFKSIHEFRLREIVNKLINIDTIKAHKNIMNYNKKIFPRMRLLYLFHSIIFWSGLVGFICGLISLPISLIANHNSFILIVDGIIGLFISQLIRWLLLVEDHLFKISLKNNESS